MKKIIIIISFIISILISSIIIAEIISKSEVKKVAITFLKNLQQRNSAGVKATVSKHVSFKILDRKTIISLADKMMLEEIPVVEYILNLTGHNILDFLEGSAKLAEYSDVKDYGIDRIVDKHKIGGDFYYIKFNITYNSGTKKIKDKLVEIDIREENGKLKIFGFIL